MQAAAAGWPRRATAIRRRPSTLYCSALTEVLERPTVLLGLCLLRLWVLHPCRDAENARVRAPVRDTLGGWHWIARTLALLSRLDGARRSPWWGCGELVISVILDRVHLEDLRKFSRTLVVSTVPS